MFKPNQCTPLPEHDKALKNRVTCKNIKREVIEKAARGRQPDHPMQLQHLCAQWGGDALNIAMLNSCIYFFLQKRK